MGLKQCYFCGKEATSKEHVPPKSFFPDKDKHRLNLITVPSCHDHNNKKSGTDEYILQFFAGASKLHREDEDIFLTYVHKKAAKSMYVASKKKEFMSVIDILKKNHPDPKLVLQMNSVNGNIPQYTYSVQINEERIFSFLESVARGIFKKENGTHWEGDIRLWPHFIIGLKAPMDTKKTSRELANLIDESKSKGTVKNIFYYYLADLKDGNYCVDMCFYREFKATCFFKIDNN